MRARAWVAVGIVLLATAAALAQAIWNRTAVGRETVLTEREAPISGGSRDDTALWLRVQFVTPTDSAWGGWLGTARLAALGADTTVEATRRRQMDSRPAFAVLEFDGPAWREHATERVAEHARALAADSSLTGRDSLLSRKFGWKDKDADLNKIAVWSYFEGAMRDPGLDEGATTVAYVPQKGWFWYIPLHSNIVSVGVVGEPSYLYRDTRDPDTIFHREANACAWIRDHISHGKQVEPVRVTGEYSYHSKQIGGDGFCLVGDAFAFLDPLFSTGVFLALKSGEMAADTIHAALTSGDGQVNAGHMDDYLASQRRAVMSFRQLVRAFYDLSFSFREFLQVYPHLNSLIVDTLVGNVFTDLTPLFNALEEYKAKNPRREIDVTTA